MIRLQKEEIAIIVFTVLVIALWYWKVTSTPAAR